MNATSFFTYESRIPEIEKQIPGATILYNIASFRRTRSSSLRRPIQRKGKQKFVSSSDIMSPPIQKLIAEKYGFRPGTVVDLQGPVQKLKLLRLGIVRNPNPMLVKAVFATVSTPPTP